MRRLVVLVLLVGLVRAGCGACADDDREVIRLGTFNIRFFPEDTADLPAVTARIAELDADAFAVQEIVDPSVLAQVVADAGRATGRDYALTLGTYCSKERVWWLGVVYDRRRMQLVDARSLTDRVRCATGHPSMHVALLERGDERLALAAVHLKAGGEPRQHARRKREWMQVLATQRRLERELGAPVVVAGDYNTTGFRDDAAGERSYIESLTRSAGLQVLTSELACSAYWRPDRYAPSLLDHIVASDGVRFENVRVLGYCRELGCAPVDERPREHATVSDHCPVAVDYLP